MVAAARDRSRQEAVEDLRGHQLVRAQGVAAATQGPTPRRQLRAGAARLWLVMRLRDSPFRATAATPKGSQVRSGLPAAMAEAAKAKHRHLLMAVDEAHRFSGIGAELSLLQVK